MKNFSRSAIAVATATALAFTQISAVSSGHYAAFAAEETTQSRPIFTNGSLGGPNWDNGSKLETFGYLYAGTNAAQKQHSFVTIGDTVEFDLVVTLGSEDQSTKISLVNYDIDGWTRTVTVTMTDGSTSTMDGNEKTFDTAVKEVKISYTKTVNADNLNSISITFPASRTVEAGRNLEISTQSTLPSTGTYTPATATVTVADSSKIKVKLYSGDNEPQDYTAVSNNTATVTGYDTVKAKIYYELVDGSFYASTAQPYTFTGLSNQPGIYEVPQDVLDNLSGIASSYTYYGKTQADILAAQKTYINENSLTHVNKENAASLKSAYEEWTNVAKALKLTDSRSSFSIPGNLTAASDALAFAKSFLAAVVSTQGSTTHPSLSAAEEGTNTSIADLTASVSRALVDYAFDEYGKDLNGARYSVLKTQALTGDNAAKAKAVEAAIGLSTAIPAALKALEENGGATGSGTLTDAYNNAVDDLKQAVTGQNPVVTDPQKITDLITRLTNAAKTWREWNDIAGYTIDKKQADALQEAYANADPAGRVTARNNALAVAAANQKAREAIEGYAAVKAADYNGASTELKNAYITAYNALAEVTNTSTDVTEINDALANYNAALQALTAASSDSSQQSTETQPSENETDTTPETPGKKSGSSGSSAWWLLLTVPGALVIWFGARWATWFQNNPGWVGAPPTWWWLSNFPPA